MRNMKQLQRCCRCMLNTYLSASACDSMHRILARILANSISNVGMMDSAYVLLYYLIQCNNSQQMSIQAYMHMLGKHSRQSRQSGESSHVQCMYDIVQICTTAKYITCSRQQSRRAIGQAMSRYDGSRCGGNWVYLWMMHHALNEQSRYEHNHDQIMIDQQMDMQDNKHAHTHIDQDIDLQDIAQQISNSLYGLSRQGSMQHISHRDKYQYKYKYQYKDI